MESVDLVWIHRFEHMLAPRLTPWISPDTLLMDIAYGIMDPYQYIFSLVEHWIPKVLV